MHEETGTAAPKAAEEKKKGPAVYGPARRPSLEAFQMGMHVEIEGVHFRIEKVTGKRVVLNAIPIQRKETV